MTTINLNQIAHAVTFLNVAGFTGTALVGYGLIDLLRGFYLNDEQERAVHERRSYQVIAAGVAALALSLAVHTLLEPKIETLRVLSKAYGTTHIIEKISEESLICKIDALTHILSQNQQPINSALFDHIGCDSFLPWQEHFQEVKGSPYLFIEGIQHIDMAKGLMWGISPSKIPFLTMAHQNFTQIPQNVTETVTSKTSDIFQRVDEIITLGIEKNYFSIISKCGQSAQKWGLEAKDGILIQKDKIELILNTLKCDHLTNLFFSLVPKNLNAV